MFDQIKSYNINKNVLERKNKLFDLFYLLSNKKYYSLSITYVSSKLNLSIEYLKNLDFCTRNRLNDHIFNSSLYFFLLFNDFINIFDYNNITYIGLESRRIDYENDKINNCNWVEDKINSRKFN